MKKCMLTLVVCLTFLLQSCGNKKEVGQIEMVSPMEVYQAVHGKEKLQLVDVRTPDEFDVSHLKDAQNICVTSDDFKERVTALNKDEPVYVYCKKGGRSARAASILKKMGFLKVYDLQGGLTNWQQEGLETIN